MKWMFDRKGRAHVCKTVGMRCTISNTSPSCATMRVFEFRAQGGCKWHDVRTWTDAIELCENLVREYEEKS